jgi:hypothetical protein
MVVATHLIKVKGEFNTSIWNSYTLKSYVMNKIQEIDYSLHPDLELFDVKNNNINVWIYLSALPSEVSRKIVDEWAFKHISEEGLIVKEISIEVIFDMTKQHQHENKMKVIIT